MNSIPEDVALQICDEIRRENHGKWYTFSRLQCWGCLKFSKGDLAKMCLGSEGGCNLISKRYAQRSDKTD